MVTSPTSPSLGQHQQLPPNAITKPMQIQGGGVKKAAIATFAATAASAKSAAAAVAPKAAAGCTYSTYFNVPCVSHMIPTD
jgi:hypothetical protein